MPDSPTDSAAQSFEVVACAIRRWLVHNDIPQLAAALVEHGHLLLEEGERTLVQEALIALPVPWRDSNPQLLFLYAQLKAEAGVYQEAIQLYEQAGRRYGDTGDRVQQVHCFLQLARIYHRLEDLEAARFYTDHAHRVLEQLVAVEDHALAEMHLTMARLAPDAGRIGYSATHAEQALHFYERVGEIPKQLEALLLLAGAANQTGYPQTSLSLLRIARARYTALDNNVQWELAIGNQQAHCLWYLARFAEAAQIAETTVNLADTVPHTKQRVYLRLLLGNIYRARRRFSEAHRCYDEAEALLTPLGFTLYRVWIDVHRAWLRALENDLVTAKAELRHALTQCDYGQAMSFNVFLAAIYSLERQFDAAEQLLHQSKEFYETSGDWLSVCALGIHLAYIAIQKQQFDDARAYIQPALAWMAGHNLYYFPHWWHDHIVATVMVYALRHSIYPATVEQILLGPLRSTIHSVVRPLLQPDTPSVQLDAAAHIDLSFASNPKAREVLSELLSSGWLGAERFEELKARMVTGKRRGHTNATLMAVFGLYVRGWSRGSIAERLAIADSTVRNYITQIYEIFHLEDLADARPHRRLVHLRHLARQEGFIAPHDHL